MDHCRKPFIIMVSIISCVLCLQRAMQAAENDKTEKSFAILVQGDISLKRKGWTKYQSVSFGTSLHADDLVKVGPSSSAKIVCSDLRVHELLPGPGPIPCAAKQQLLHSKDGSAVQPTRGTPFDGSFPIILSPRRTKLFSPNPILRWTPVQGATIYTVEIRGWPKFLWGAQISNKTVLTYPIDAPRLKPGVDYKLIVFAGDNNSSEEPIRPGFGFRILDPKEVSIIANEQNQIESLGLPTNATGYMIAYLYSTNGLRAEAIQRLELLLTQTNAPAVARLLGDLYLEVGLVREAEAYYLTALKLYTAQNDIEGQMMVQFALASIYEDALGNAQLARQDLEATLVLANSIGDQSMAAQARERLAKLNKAGV
jgi:hypothetical protein